MSFWDSRGSRRLAVALIVGGWALAAVLRTHPIEPLGVRAAGVGPVLVGCGLAAFARRVHQTGDFFLTLERGAVRRYHLGARHAVRALVLAALACASVAVALALPELELAFLLLSAALLLLVAVHVPFAFRKEPSQRGM